MPGPATISDFHKAFRRKKNVEGGLSLRQISMYASRLLRGEPIPLFVSKAVNVAIDKKADAILAARKVRIKKHRTTGTFYRGEE